MVLGGTGAITASTNRYKFGGKELNASDNIFLADFHVRQYDPALTRWLVPDPMEESEGRLSPYVYCANDPINYTDPTGMTKRGMNELYKEYNDERQRNSEYSTWTPAGRLTGQWSTFTTDYKQTLARNLAKEVIATYSGNQLDKFFADYDEYLKSGMWGTVLLNPSMGEDDPPQNSGTLYLDIVSKPTIFKGQPLEGPKLGTAISYNLQVSYEVAGIKTILHQFDNLKLVGNYQFSLIGRNSLPDANYELKWIQYYGKAFLIDDVGAGIKIHNGKYVSHFEGCWALTQDRITYEQGYIRFIETQRPLNAIYNTTLYYGITKIFLRTNGYTTIQ